MTQTREELQRRIGALGPEIVRVSSAYRISALYQGMEALAHAYLMLKARGVVRGEVSLEDFVNRFSLEFGQKNPGCKGFTVLLKSIEGDGIIVPEQAYLPEFSNKAGENRTVGLFDNHWLGNWVRYDDARRSYAVRLIERIWQKEDLRDKSLVDDGALFGLDLWRTHAQYFEDRLTPRPLAYSYDEGGELLVRGIAKPQPEEVTLIGRELFRYNTEILERLSI